MTRAMYMAVVFLMASAVVQANQCSGGSECQSDINPSNVASVLETKPQMGALNDGGEDNPCSSGGECPSDDSSKHVVSMFQTKLRMHMGEVGGEAAASESYHSTEGLVGKMTGQLGNLMLKGNPNAILAELEQQVSSGVAPPFNVVSKIKRLIVEEILPDLEVAKDAAVQDTAGWLSAVGRCNNDFKSSEAYPGSTFHQAVSTSRIAHSNCRHDLQSMNTSYCVKLDKLLNDTCPSTTKPVPDTSTRATAVQYAKDLLHAIVQSGDNCTDQEQKLADKKVECAADQTSFESSFCYWKIELESDCKSLDRCYSESLGDYNDHAAKMKILWEKWDVETATLQKILCYCNLWLDEEDERDGRAQTNATNFQVCNKITHTPSPAISEPPAKVDCLLTSVAHHPGEQSFITREYGSSIDFVAPLVPCMEAPTIVPSTVAPTTTQVPITEAPTTEAPTTEAPTTEAAPTTTTTTTTTTTAGMSCEKRLKQIVGDIADCSADTGKCRVYRWQGGGCPKSGVSLVDIANACPGNELTDIHLERCKKVHGDIQALSSLTGLTELHLSETDAYGDIMALSSMTQMNDLRLELTNVSGDIAAVSSMTSMINLNLHSTKVSGDITALPSKLVYLRLDSTKVYGDIAAFSSMTDMQSLDIADTNVHGDIEAFSSLTSMYRLNLGSPWPHLSIADVHGDIKALSSLTKLMHISLAGTNVDGDIGTGLSSLTKLKHLQLRKTKVTGSCGDHFYTGYNGWTGYNCWAADGHLYGGMR